MAKNANKKAGVWHSLRNAWKVPDIRKKILYTFTFPVINNTGITSPPEEGVAYKIFLLQVLQGSDDRQTAHQLGNNAKL